MKRFIPLALLTLLILSTQAAPPTLTIYNGDFGLVRETIPLDLHEGENDIRYADVTSQLDSGTVILRDPSGKAELNVIEQKFRGLPIGTSAMLRLFEGQTIDFIVPQNGKNETVKGKILRGDYSKTENGVTNSVPAIIEMDGTVRFGLPGAPKFPSLPVGVAIKRELDWKIKASKPQKFDAELAYITNGLRWEADYEAVVGEKGNISQFIGWMTITNNTEKTFENANVVVVAGAVNRTTNPVQSERTIVTGSNIPNVSESLATPQQREFNDLREYSLPRPITLMEGDAAEVEFIRAADINATRSYVYHGVELYLDLSKNSAELSPQVDKDFNTSVVAAFDFKNSSSNHLGMPIPAGRIHFYSIDADKQLQFTGESNVWNVPPDETVRAVTGNAFDLVGEHRQIDFQVDEQKHTADESFEIKLRSHKKEPVEIIVLENLFRWKKWEIKNNSDPFKVLNAGTIEFRVQVKPNEEKVVRYTAHYSQLPPK